MVKTYIVFPDKSFKEIKIKNNPDIVFFKNNNKYYHVIKTVSEVVNDNLIYNWINLEEII